MKILASRLYAAESARQNAARSAERRSQVGTGDAQRAHPHLQLSRRGG